MFKYRFGSARTATVKIVAAAVAAFALAGGAGAQSRDAPSPQEVRLTHASLADLEDAFWVCDYVATTYGVADGDMAGCAAIYDAFKARKFGGDFDKLLLWWQRNKAARHARLGALDSLAGADSK